MASQNRQERQLMRQRGAGARNATNTDFGLDLGFVGNRQDRLQQRQRGAGNRKVDDVDFGFSFRTPDGSRRSNSRASNSSFRIAKAPGRGSRESSTARSQRSTSRASNAEREKRASQEPLPRPDPQDVRSTKRRRLAAESTEDEPFINDPLPARRASRRKTSSMFAIAEDPEDQGPLLGEEDDDDVRNDTMRAGLLHSLPDGNHEKENTGADNGKAPAKRKKRRSVGQQSMRKKKRPSEDSTNATRPWDDDHSTILTSRPDSPSSEQESEHGSRSDHDREHSSLDERSPQISKPPSKRRRKRKSVVLVKKKRRSSEGMKSQSRSKTVTQGSVTQQGEHQHNEQSRGPDRHRNIHPPSSVSRSSPVMRSIEIDDASDEEYIDEDESPEPPTPAPTKKGKLPTKARTAVSKALGRNPEQTKRSRKSTFPVMTHRITNAEALPTIHEEDEDKNREDDDDASTAVHTFSHRAAPNVADVLAQICRETIETTIERMETIAGQESRAIRQRKRSALEAFGADLDSRLLDVSAAAEDRLDLEARVRKVKHEKNDLQSRWLEIRSQRERVALKCDSLRREHWENEQSREDRWSISEAARKAELELDRNSPDGEEALEYLVRSVADEVTNADGGGLLNRMKLMNTQLEKMAGVLEGRAG